MRKSLLLISLILLFATTGTAGILDGVYDGKGGVRQFCPDESLNGPIGIKGKTIIISGNHLRITLPNKVAEGDILEPRIDKDFDLWGKVEGNEFMFSFAIIGGKRHLVTSFKDMNGCVNTQAFQERDSF